VPKKAKIAVPQIDPIKSLGDLDTLPNLSVFAPLSEGQINVLQELVKDSLSNNVRTTPEIAESAGVSERSVRLYRSDPVWSQALGVLMVGVARGKSDIYLRLIEKAAEKDWRAAKFLFELSGIFVPKSQQLNVNVNASEYAHFENVEDMIDEFLRKLHQLGWSADRLVARYNAVR
jgi:hypothetical protein